MECMAEKLQACIDQNSVLTECPPPINVVTDTDLRFEQDS
jgi:hypothetical protein